MFLMPYEKNLWDDFASPLERFLQGMDTHSITKNFMTTDVIEKADNMELIMDLPGIKKENIKIELSEGYLTITASGSSASEEKDQAGNYIRKERQSGKYTRSFYVGKNLTEEDVKAKFENGTLILDFPKDQKKIEHQKKTIIIDG